MVNHTFPHAKLDALIDVKDSIILDYHFWLKPRHIDVVAAKKFFRRMKCKDSLILGDGAYDCEELHKLAEKIIMSSLARCERRVQRKTPKGYFRKKCVKKHAQYGMRNKVESTFHALKAVHVSALKNRLHLTRKRNGLAHYGL